MEEQNLVGNATGLAEIMGRHDDLGTHRAETTRGLSVTQNDELLALRDGGAI